MAKLVRKKCPCLRPKMEPEVEVLDYRHSSLTDVPSDVFNFERTLQELYTDSNQIRDLPRELFYCHGLRKLSVSDNEITSIPPAIASLDYLEELDFSKNGIIDVPDNIKCCKYLRVIDASVNPLGKLPEGFTQLQNLTHLYLNDTFLDYLPGSFGRLVKLKILELRENHLKTLPKSFGRLTELERLDIGNNEFIELPDVVGSLVKLLELWCDNNQITSITHAIGALTQLMFLDASKNLLEALPGEIEGCTCLADLHLSCNQLQTLPDSIGSLSNLTTLKADDNQLTSLPRTLGGLTSLSELNVSVNDLEDLPASIGLLRNLRTFYADENLLTFVPAELGSCSGITVLSLRSNKLTYIPDEIGRIPRLRVINLSDNLLHYLPFTIVKLKELQALWLTENQTRPLIPLQSDYEADTGRKILTCYLLPQGQNSANDETLGDGDTDSFHASIWDEERLQRQQIHFSFGDDEEDEGHLVRCPTPYPKEMREKARHMRNLAMRQSLRDGTGGNDGCSQQSATSGHTGQQNGGLGSPGTGDGVIDVRVGEARISKPQSPSLSSETHRLYRYDKEKQIRDKAKMQHRHSLPHGGRQDGTVTDSPWSGERGASTSATGSDSEDGRVAGRRKSTPNLLSFDGQATAGASSAEGTTTTPRRMPSFTYEDLYHKQILHKHQHYHHHGRRVRRARDYDSDTGYKSDRETRQGNKQRAIDLKDDMSVRSQPTMSRSHRHHHHHHHHQHRHHGREGGYTSDLEAYAGRGRGLRRGNNNNSNPNAFSSPSPKPRTVTYQLHATHSVPQDLDTHATSSSQPPYPTTPLRPQSCLTVPTTSSRPHPGSSDLHSHTPSKERSPSPAHFTGDSVLDHSTPVTTQAPTVFPPTASTGQPGSGGALYSQAGGEGFLERTVQAELFSVLEERKRKVVGADQRPSPIPSTVRSPHVRKTPPPYHPAPPYRRPADKLSDQSADSCSVQSSPRDSAKGVSAFSNPEYTAVQYSSSSSSIRGRDPASDRQQEDQSREYETLGMAQRAVEGQPTSSSHGQQQYGTLPYYSQNLSESARGSPYKDYGEGARTSSDVFVEGAQLPYKGHYVQGTRTANEDLVQGSRASPYKMFSDNARTSGDVFVNGARASPYKGSGQDGRVNVDSFPEGHQSSPYQGYGERPHRNSGKSFAERPQASCPGYGDEPRYSGRSLVEGAQSSPYQTYGQRPRTSSDGSSGSYTPHNDSRLVGTHYPPVSAYGDSARGPNVQNPSHSPYTVRTPSSVQYPNRSRDNLTPIGAQYSPGMVRQSPGLLRLPVPTRPRAGSRDNVLDGTDPGLTSPKAFEAYPNPYGEPLEVGDPLMSRYEDVAMFKSMQNPSQVSSSTDSGYGHGHQIYERVGDFNARRSGSPYSATPPPHRDSPVRHNSSSQGTPSRETTPVREEGPPQTPSFTEGSRQECRDVFRTVIHKNPGLGFSIAGGKGAQTQNPFRYGDSGIFVTKIQSDGPAAAVIQPGDKILQVNHIDFGNIDHTTAVNVLKTSSTVDLLVERVQKVNMV